MVYLAELLVVMTDQLKIVRILARNVHRIHGHKCLDDDASLASLSRHESDGVVFWMRRVAVLLKHKKLILGQPAHILQWPLSEKVIATVCLFTIYYTKSEQSDCNKSSVR